MYENSSPYVNNKKNRYFEIVLMKREGVSKNKTKQM